MLRHQFRQDFVFLTDFLFQLFDARLVDAALGLMLLALQRNMPVEE